MYCFWVLIGELKTIVFATDSDVSQPLWVQVEINLCVHYLCPVIINMNNTELIYLITMIML